MKRILNVGLPVLAMLITPLAAFAAPVLQVGAPCPDISVCGTYEDYVANSTDPTETDTAITNGSTILFGGTFGPNTLKLGGQYDDSVDGPNGLPDGDDYSGVDANLTVFDGHDAIAVIAVPDGTAQALAEAITLGGNTVFHYSTTLSGLFPNNHDPLKDAVSDFVFIDIGNFEELIAMPDFADETIGQQLGEIITLTLGGVDASIDWIHFDVVALQTDTQGQTEVKTSWANNPGSHDVTWKGGNGGSGGEGGSEEIPEPGVLALLGMGLLGMVLTRRRYSR